MRRRPAPSVARIAISRSRAEPRTMRRLATLAHAMRRTSPTAPSSTPRNRRRVLDQPILEPGNGDALEVIEAGTPERVVEPYLRGDGANLRGILFPGYAGREPSDDLVAVAAPERAALLVHLERNPEPRAVGKAESARRHADHGPEHPIEIDSAAHGGGSEPKRSRQSP